MRDLIFRDGRVYLAMDEALGAFPSPAAALQAAEVLGMDEGVNRVYDRDRRLHVGESRISKANICDYYGREIPKCVELGLDPNKRYRLLRHPDELKKAADTFNNLPILMQHTHVTAEDHKPELIIGTTGSNAKYEHPYLLNGTSFWAGGAVSAINSEWMKELSSSYHYQADMTPGEYEGEPYDGVMRDIVGNHVALVRDGRAGDDVVVGDSKPKEFFMTKAVLSRTALFAAGATSALIAAKLAMDEKPIDTSALFEGVTTKNYLEMKPKIVERVRASLAGVKLAQDATIDDVVKIVDALEQPDVQEGADVDPATGSPMDADALKAAMLDGGAADLDVDAKRREFLAGKLSAEDMAAYDSLGGAPDMENDDEDEENPIMENAVKPIDKTAMDSAIKSALETAGANYKAIRSAEIAIEPYVGRLAIAFDSADAVYEKALNIMGVNVKGVHASALPAILALQPKPGAKQAPSHSLAMDSKPSADFAARFPGAERIGVA